MKKRTKARYKKGVSALIRAESRAKRALSEAKLLAREQRKAEKEQIRAERAERKRPQFGPPRPYGLGWGGARAGCGRPKRVGPSPSSMVAFRLPSELARKLESLPQRSKSGYFRKALELLADIAPPGESRAAAANVTTVDVTDTSPRLP